MRAVYGGGVLDYLMDNGISFDLGIGVSAGAANIATYIAGQRGRVRRFYEIYPRRKEYMGLWSLMSTGNFLNLDYVYSELSDEGKEDPFGIDAFHSNPMGFIAVTTDAETGCPRYLAKAEVRKNDLSAFKASCALPIACKPVMLDGRACFDGGLSDPIPYEKAFSMGADRVVVILTLPRTKYRDPEKDRKLAALLSRQYPAAGERLLRRAETYNNALKGMEKYEKEGKLLAVAPEELFGVTTIKHKAKGINALYAEGFKDAERIPFFLSGSKGQDKA